MSLNGLVHPERKKCESANWRWVRAHQLAPQGYGPTMDLTNRCNYGDIAPYTDERVVSQMNAELPLRVEGYPNVTMCGKLGPLIYLPKIDKDAGKRQSQCNCGPKEQQWPWGFYCGKH